MAESPESFFKKPSPMGRGWASGSFQIVQGVLASVVRAGVEIGESGFQAQRRKQYKKLFLFSYKTLDKKDERNHSRKKQRDQEEEELSQPI